MCRAGTEPQWSPSSHWSQGFQAQHLIFVEITRAPAGSKPRVVCLSDLRTFSAATLPLSAVETLLWQGQCRHVGPLCSRHPHGALLPRGKWGCFQVAHSKRRVCAGTPPTPLKAAFSYPHTAVLFLLSIHIPLPDMLVPTPTLAQHYLNLCHAHGSVVLAMGACRLLLWTYTCPQISYLKVLLALKILFAGYIWADAFGLTCLGRRDSITRYSIHKLLV